VTARTRAAWTARLRTAGLSIPERLVAGQLAERLTRPTGAHVDPAELAACICLPHEVCLTALDALRARRLVSADAAGRLVLTLPEGGGEQR
jgi:hypothetical protein